MESNSKENSNYDVERKDISDDNGSQWMTDRNKRD